MPARGCAFFEREPGADEVLDWLPAPRTMVQHAKCFICSSLLVQAFLFVGHPIAESQTRYVVPRDFESAAGCEVVTALS